jgi:anti-sigma factor RsiW
LNCQDTQILLHAYVDGELDLVKNLEVEKHLQECSACAQAHAEIQALRAAVKSGAPYYDAPRELVGSIRESLRPAGRPRSTSFPFRSWRWLPVAASLAFAALVGYGLGILVAPRSDLVLTQELVASHVRSQMSGHKAVDVDSSDLHTVKPWFDGRVDFSPTVPDLVDKGFALVGGRLDYLDNKAVAVLVYQRRKHLIDLFIWRSDAAEDALGPTKLSRQGFTLLSWNHGGMTYWAVSNLNENELGEFADLVRGRIP